MDKDMAGTGIWRGYIHPVPISIPNFEKVGDFPYSYPYPVNTGISRQNRDGFRQYPREQVYLSSLPVRVSY